MCPKAPAYAVVLPALLPKTPAREPTAGVLRLVHWYGRRPRTSDTRHFDGLIQEQALGDDISVIFLMGLQGKADDPIDQVSRFEEEFRFVHGG